MTTQDQQPEGIGSTRGVESSLETTGSTERTGASSEATGYSAMGTVPSTETTESSAQQSLFAEDELSVLRLRWDEVQSGFVDDPRECVHKADGLVSDVVDRLTTGFSEARSRLEEQWARGEEGSTEDLRLALKRYRDFFQRLLAV
ncbi:hypothetical protein [Rhodococcus sp. IEGM 1379]|uniref:hypothetical protein n=1 Tax=Rhodococcus sp. IEGM 1379 TaxID=3047086 RepID=UPI0024B742BC|nr:hypothetical protein [Rhodococcus sp. IEGM 1379]MDI9918481.1 hypothetical protein [Rhodococcus sp. IEGM 1379]